MGIFRQPPQPQQGRKLDPPFLDGTVWGDTPKPVYGARDPDFMYNIVVSWMYPQPVPEYYYLRRPKLFTSAAYVQPPPSTMPVYNIVMTWYDTTQKYQPVQRTRNTFIEGTASTGSNLFFCNG